jgi:hypothetical protein
VTSFHLNLPSDKKAPALEISRKMVNRNERGFEKFIETVGA